jgi:hypothetical protein
MSAKSIPVRRERRHMTVLGQHGDAGHAIRKGVTAAWPLQ